MRISHSRTYQYRECFRKFVSVALSSSQCSLNNDNGFIKSICSLRSRLFNVGVDGDDANLYVNFISIIPETRFVPFDRKNALCQGCVDATFACQLKKHLSKNVYCPNYTYQYRCWCICNFIVCIIHYFSIVSVGSNNRLTTSQLE